MTFKDTIQQDIGIFLNLGEFADVHDINGLKIPAVIDSNILKTRSNDKTEQYDGVYRSEIAVYVRADDLPMRPVFGQEILLDGKAYLVDECNEEMGVLEIVLGANES
ncbi:hypothetical protein [Moorella sp. E306M]|jgi:hypothetical protein|uniref:hypothetical protein n=1 Tax=Moorella sp. E306M TaxID=2572683 RepID=UPI0010FFB903|nr:hypothetical protein [Moorella sp. E306M]GEA17745.1 hypothetical protein E306M_08790 [Moorella sp. E306M]GEA17814.1 hypothetical protein E306M_09480 [Moorella sp. E306M]